MNRVRHVPTAVAGAALALAALTLGGCGQKGPLYLPDPRPTPVPVTPASEPSPVAQPTTAPSPPSASDPGAPTDKPATRKL